MSALRKRVAMACIGLALLLAWAAPASALTIDEYPPEPGAVSTAFAPRYIHQGPDGYVWAVTGGTRPGVVRIKGEGVRGESTAMATVRPVDFVVDGDGTAYFSGDDSTARLSGSALSTNGVGSSYGVAITALGEIAFGKSTKGSAVCTSDEWAGGGVCHYVQGAPGKPTGILLGPNGALWVMHNEADLVQSMTPTFSFAFPTAELPGSGPKRAAVGSDGNVWVTMQGADAIDRFTPTGQRTRFPLPAGSRPNDIAVGPEGALWFTEPGTSTIGRMDVNGNITGQFPTPTPNAQPFGITAGPDNDVWFTEQATGLLGRILPNGSSGGGGGATTNPPPPTAGSGGGAAKPRFTKAPAFVPSRFKVGPMASKLELSLSGPAAVSIAFERPARGRKVGGRCVAPSKGNGAKPRCTRYLTLGKLGRSLPVGPSSIAFNGRLAGNALSPGSYRVTVTAKDSSGNSAVAVANFAILAPAR